MRGNGPSRILGGPEIGTRRPEAGADGWTNGGECVRIVHALEGLQPAGPRGRGGVLEPQLSEPLVATRLPRPSSYCLRRRGCGRTGRAGSSHATGSTAGWRQRRSRSSSPGARGVSAFYEALRSVTILKPRPAVSSAPCEVTTRRRGFSRTSRSSSPKRASCGYPQQQIMKWGEGDGASLAPYVAQRGKHKGRCVIPRRLVG